MGEVTEDCIREMLRTGPMRTLQKSRTHVREAVVGALGRMQRAGALTITDADPKSRNTWGVAGEAQREPLYLAEHRARTWIDTRTAAGQRVTVAMARQQNKKQHKAAGGAPSDLTEVIKAHLREMALAGKLIPDTRATEVLNLFSGGQSAGAPAAASNLGITHVDILAQYQISDPGEAEWIATTRDTTDLRTAPDLGMVKWVMQRESIGGDLVLLVAAAIPCHTWTHLDATLRPSGNSYRTKSGRPNQRNPAKAKEAEEQYELARNTVLSVLEWIYQGAYMGIQRYYLFENGAWGVLGDQDFMAAIPPPRVVSYCKYRARLGTDEQYPAQKDTSIWTNLQGWTPRRCNHRNHVATIGGSSTMRPKLQGMSKWATKRWTPEELYWDLLASLRHRPREL
jgi:hypothetical protein